MFYAAPLLFLAVLRTLYPRAATPCILPLYISISDPIWLFSCLFTLSSYLLDAIAVIFGRL
ncbi:hypothetical protein P170DRAFT_140450 [Aspergillus steynii IBT 23096]|uniref:Uncharacterized protein n=1 Tax=Aspergillus steynii IBT 23096 TaxID=1392250 RepID=A0A2I2GBK7_9EURO|nr:uncharacterized protein P170DRAFT_140450 [Aspergillus steynii IBT 23096]PLB50264.1 hypothetical protein P170DRAFT_140450 [Aspergillus steynii IBT 23096]